MRYANLIPHSHIARTADPRLTADARRVFTRAKAAVNVCTVKGGPIPGRCGGVKPGQWRPAA